ncbi:MAG: BatD family protein [Polyangiaceae bacterium]|nr:BatD family protein [Polyangiaceae bacterium]
MTLAAAFARSRWLGLAAAAATGLSSASASAQALTLRASARRVEVGETFQVQLSVMGDPGSAAPSAPRLSIPARVTAEGPAVSSRQEVSISGGRVQQRTGFVAAWALVASHTGKYRIGPGSVAVGSGRVQSERVEVEVVAQGSRAPGVRRRGGTGLDLFGPFGGLGDPFGAPLGDPFGLDSPLPPVPAELRVDRAPDPTAFLRAVVMPERVVLGQQVTLRVLAYGSQGPFIARSTGEPTRDDFLGVNLLDDPLADAEHALEIEGRRWHATKVRELALVPLRTGVLRVGAARVAFEGRGYRASRGVALERSSRAVEVAVEEPPVAGRPSGYRLGDVGRFALRATVEPRTVRAGGAVGVTITLEGTGQLPPAPIVPRRDGVEWLDPTVTEDAQPDGGRLRGWRTFVHAVRLTRPGRQELGEVTLPHWDPELGAYAVARAALGSIEVQPGEVSEDSAPRSPLAALAVRGALGAPSAAPRWLADRRWFVPALVAGPLAAIAIAGTLRGFARARRTWRDRRESAAARAVGALAEARRAARAGDVRGAAAAIDRALVAGVADRVGVALGGGTRAEARGRLVDAGCGEELTARVLELLERCDDARFAGSEVEPGELVRAAAEVLSRLAAVERAGRGGAP